MSNKLPKPEGRTGAARHLVSKNLAQGEEKRDRMLCLFRKHREEGLPCPINSELRAATGLRSSATIHAHLKQLVREGKLAQRNSTYYLVEESNGQG